MSRGTDATGPYVLLQFAPPPGDPDVQFRVQRQVTGAPAWMPVSPWLDAGSTTFRDRGVSPTGGYTYRVQAMDSAGNVGNFTAPRPAP